MGERQPALCLRTYDFGDSSQIVVLFARSKGKLRCMARGAKNSVKRFAGALEPLTLLSADIGGKKTRDGLLTLRETDVLDGFFYVRRRLPSLAAGCYLLDFLAELLPEAVPHEPLFELALATLRRLAGAKVDLAEEVLVFELLALQILGIVPNLESCVQCGGAVDFSRDATFDTRQGGLVCKQCQVVGKPLAVCAGTRATARALLGAAAETPFSELREAFRLTQRGRAELRRVLDAQVEDFLDRDLRVRKHWKLFAGKR